MDTIYKPIDRLTYLIYKKYIPFRDAFDIVYKEMISIMEKEQNNFWYRQWKKIKRLIF